MALKVEDIDSEIAKAKQKVEVLRSDIAAWSGAIQSLEWVRAKLIEVEKEKDV